MKKWGNDILRECAAELLATYVLTLIGNSVIAVSILNNIGAVSHVSEPLGWGLGLLAAMTITGGVSGCHANPAVTLAFATVGKLPWNRVGFYMIAQYMGAFISAIIVYALHYDAILYFDKGYRSFPPNVLATAQIFATFPAAHIGIFTALCDQIVGTMVLMMAIVAITDPRNMAVQKGFYPVTIGLVLTTIIFAFPMNCGAPLNPARDFGPRVFIAIAGWGSEAFSYSNYSYFWIPIMGPHTGTILGAWVYKLLIEHHWPEVIGDVDLPPEITTHNPFVNQNDLVPVDSNSSHKIESTDSIEAQPNSQPMIHD